MTEEIIHCIISKNEIHQDKESLIIEKKDYPSVAFETEETDDAFTLRTAKGQRRAESSHREISWKHSDGTIWLMEKGKDLTEIEVVHYTTGDEEPID